MHENAILSSEGSYTTFSFGGHTITFMTSPDIERYLKINEWDNGYIAVQTKYKSRPPEEEYIDLAPILESLYMDPEKFLSPIKGVEIRYA